MEAKKSSELLPYSEFQQGNYAIYNGRVVMIFYHIGKEKVIITLNEKEIKEVYAIELNPIELSESVLKKCSPVTIKNGKYIFEFVYGTYSISVNPINNYVEVSITSSGKDAKITFSNVVYSLHILQNIIMAFAKHIISYTESNNQSEE